MSRLMLLLLLLSVATACGKKKSSNSGRVAEIPQSEVEVAIRQQSISCAGIGGSTCPDGVARLLIVNPEDEAQSSACSGFMVDQTTLVTNNHCLSTQSDCDNTWIAVYDGETYLPTRCKKIISTFMDFPTEDPRKSVDVTVLEIGDLFTGKAFKLSSRRAIDGDRITAWVVDHTGLDAAETNLLDSRITELRCRAIDDEDYGSLILESCPVIAGNSGSPVVNRHGEVVGVVWGGTSWMDSADDLEERRDNFFDVAAVTEMINFFRTSGRAQNARRGSSLRIREL